MLAWFFKGVPDDTNIEPLCHTPESNITLCQLHLNKKIKREGPQTAGHREYRKAKRENIQKRGRHRGGRSGSGAKKRGRSRQRALGWREGGCPWDLSPSFSPAPPSCLDTERPSKTVPFPTKSGHPRECFNRITLLKLWFSDVMEIKHIAWFLLLWFFWWLSN